MVKRMLFSLALAGLALAVIKSLPDITRYLKIRAM